MKKDDISVLLVDGHTNQVLPFAKAFKKLSCSVTTINFSKLDVGYSSRYPDKKILETACFGDEEGRLKTIRALLQTQKYQIVIPTSDFSAILLSKNKVELSRYAYIAIADWETIQIACDKYSTMKVCMDYGIPCTKTLLNVNCIQDILDANPAFPLVVKPRISYGAIGFNVVKTKEELLNLLAKEDVSLNDIIIQEYIFHTDLQYEAAMFIDSNNITKTALVFSKNRWFPINGGSSTLNITVEDKEIVTNCEKLLKQINWRGCADIDLIRDPRDGVAKVLEINPRASGSVKICFEAGVDLAKQILESALGNEVTKYDKYEIGVRLRRMHTDVLWFIYSKGRFKARPSWFNFKRTKEHIFSWSDPLPWFSSTLQAFGKYKKEIKKRVFW